MIVGDPHDWKDRFITVDERLLHCILRLWPSCVALLPDQPKEDTITINLVHLLSQDAVVRRISHFIIYQHEPFGTHPGGAKFSKGKIDIAVLFDQERERYLAYECKRLNVINGGRASGATRYVNDGMSRFMTEQYAEGLPVGCMLGYVMDGDLAFASTQIGAAIGAKRVPLSLVTGPISGQPITGVERFSTWHHRANESNIELRHVLLPFSNSRLISVAAGPAVAASNAATVTDL